MAPNLEDRNIVAGTITWRRLSLRVLLAHIIVCRIAHPGWWTGIVCVLGDFSMLNSRQQLCCHLLVAVISWNNVHVLTLTLLSLPIHFPTFSVLHLYPVFYFLPHCWLCLDMCNLQEWIKWLTSQLGIRKLWFRAHMIERTWSEINECSTTLLTAERLVVLLIRRTLLIVTDILPTMTWSSDLSKKLSHCVHHNWMMCSS